MNEFERPQARISKMAGCEVAFSEIRAGSARQILPQETWSRIGPAPCARRNRVRMVWIPGATELVITSRISEQIR